MHTIDGISEKQILVTGGTGFVGAYIIQQLIHKGYKVRALRRSSSQLPAYVPATVFEKVEWVEGDVLDLVSLDDAMEGIDTIIHAAAIVSFVSSDKDAMFKVNVEGTANVVNVALEKNIQRLVHISSVAALGRTESDETVTEKKQWNSSSMNTAYAITKYKAEMEVWRGIGEGLAGVILNPSVVLGYGDWNRSSSAIFKSIYNGFPWYTKGINGFVYVNDVAAAAVALMEASLSGERFIVSGENWSYERLFNTIADSFQKKRPYRLVTPFLAAIAIIATRIKKAFTGKGSIISKETAKVARTNTYYENKKILNALPAFKFTPLDDAIKMSAAQYLAMKR